MRDMQAHRDGRDRIAATTTKTLRIGGAGSHEAGGRDARVQTSPSTFDDAVTAVYFNTK